MSKTYQIVEGGELIRQPATNIEDFKKKLDRHLLEFPDSKPMVRVTSQQEIYVDVPLIFIEKQLEEEQEDMPIESPDVIEDVEEPIEQDEPVFQPDIPARVGDVINVDWYVSTSGKDSNSGKSQEHAVYSLQNLVNRPEVKNDDVIAVKAGKYIGQNVKISKTLTIIAYKDVVGDIQSGDFEYKEYGESLLHSNLIPHFIGTDRTKGIGFYLRESKGVTIQNIQISHYQSNLYGINTHDTILDNVIAAHADGVTANKGNGIFLQGRNPNAIVRNCVAFDNGSTNIWVKGDNALIEANKSYCGDIVGDKWRATDYYIKFRGNNAMVRDNFVHRIGGVSHGGHGIGTKANLGESRNFVVKNNTIIGTSEGIYMAYDKVGQGKIYGNNISKSSSPFSIRDGAHELDIYENTATNCQNGLTLWRSREEPQINLSARDITFRQNVLKGLRRGVLTTLNKDKHADAVTGCNIYENIFEADREREGTELFRNNSLTNVHGNSFRKNTVRYFDHKLAGGDTKESQFDKSDNIFEQNKF